jgi:hypothetical protein
LGDSVRVFKDYLNDPFGGFESATLDPDSSMLINAAQNMKYLSDVLLTPSQLATHIMANLHSYTQLANLHVCGLHPYEHIWSMASVSLTRLEWEVPYDRSEESPWNAVRYLEKVIQRTCPSLESLDISFCHTRRTGLGLPVVPFERVQKYRDEQAVTTTRLTNLKHFGFRFQYCSKEHERDIEVMFLDFIRRHRQSLSSISIPIGYKSWERATLHYVLTACELLPDLKDLALVETKGIQMGRNITGYELLHELTTKLSSPKLSIERLTLADIGCPFSPSIGKLFRGFASLKFLRIGDAENHNGAHGNDTRLDFESYTSVST